MRMTTVDSTIEFLSRLIQPGGRLIWLRVAKASHLSRQSFAKDPNFEIYRSCNDKPAGRFQSNRPGKLPVQYSRKMHFPRFKEYYVI